MTFAYTETLRLNLLVDVPVFRGPAGRVEGVLPLLQRLELSDSDDLHSFINDYAAAELVDQVWMALQARASIGTASDCTAALTNAGLRRWRGNKPSRDDVAAVVTMLSDRNAPAAFDEHMSDLLRDIASIQQAAAGGAGDHLAFVERARFGWKVGEPGSVEIRTDTFVQDPFDQARMEVLAAYSRRTGVASCDVCERLFVPARAGRPSRRCPGFRCAEEAERRYQLSDERREYRRLQMRLTRARRTGDVKAIEAASAALESWRDETEVAAP